MQKTAVCALLMSATLMGTPVPAGARTGDGDGDAIVRDVQIEIHGKAATDAKDEAFAKAMREAALQHFGPQANDWKAADIERRIGFIEIQQERILPDGYRATFSVGIKKETSRRARPTVVVVQDHSAAGRFLNFVEEIYAGRPGVTVIAASDEDDDGSIPEGTSTHALLRVTITDADIEVVRAGGNGATMFRRALGSKPESVIEEALEQRGSANDPSPVVPSGPVRHLLMPLHRMDAVTGLARAAGGTARIAGFVGQDIRVELASDLTDSALAPLLARFEATPLR